MMKEVTYKQELMRAKSSGTVTVLVVKAGRPTYWYSDLIGKEFIVYRLPIYECDGQANYIPADERYMFKLLDTSDCIIKEDCYARTTQKKEV